MKSITILFLMLAILSACEKNAVSSKSVNFYIAEPNEISNGFTNTKIDYNNVKLISTPLNLKDLTVYDRTKNQLIFKKSIIGWLEKYKESANTQNSPLKRCIVIQINKKNVFAAWLFPSSSAPYVFAPIMTYNSKEPNIIYLTQFEAKIITSESYIFMSEELISSGFYDILRKDNKLK